MRSVTVIYQAGKRSVSYGAQWTGLGDVIASATKAVGIKPCGGCQRRQAALNKLVPFKKVDPPVNR